MGFSPVCDPQYFFQKSGSVTFVPLWCPNSCKKLEKTNERSLRYLKTDHGRNTDGPLTTDGWTMAITNDPLRRTQGPKWG